MIKVVEFSDRHNNDADYNCSEYIRDLNIKDKDIVDVKYQVVINTENNTAHSFILLIHKVD